MMWKRILEPVARTTTPLIVHVIHVGFQCSSDVIFFNLKNVDKYLFLVHYAPHKRLWGGRRPNAFG